MVDIRGPADTPAIIFVHGAGISRKLWLPQMDSLTDTCRTLAPDLPAHGDCADEPFRFDDAVETVTAVLTDAESDCVVLVGQPLGGYVATEVAACNPDSVSGLVLSGSSADYRGHLGARTTVSSRTVFRAVERYSGRHSRCEPHRQPRTARSVHEYRP